MQPGLDGAECKPVPHDCVPVETESPSPLYDFVADAIHGRASDRLTIQERDASDALLQVDNNTPQSRAIVCRKVVSEIC